MNEILKIKIKKFKKKVQKNIGHHVGKCRQHNATTPEADAASPRYHLHQPIKQG